MNKIEIFAFDFFNLDKFSRTYKVELAIEYPRDVVYKLFAFASFVYHGVTQILYVQGGHFESAQSLTKKYYSTS